MKSNKLQKLTGIFYFIKGILGVAVSVFFTFGGGVLSIVGCTMINDVNQSETSDISEGVAKCTGAFFGVIGLTLGLVLLAAGIILLASYVIQIICGRKLSRSPSLPKSSTILLMALEGAFLLIIFVALGFVLYKQYVEKALGVSEIMIYYGLILSFGTTTFIGFALLIATVLVDAKKAKQLQ